jgi:hypothetical protein
VGLRARLAVTWELSFNASSFLRFDMRVGLEVGKRGHVEKDRMNSHRQVNEICVA